jgi:hypothetical protein
VHLHFPSKGAPPAAWRTPIPRLLAGTCLLLLAVTSCARAGPEVSNEIHVIAPYRHASTWVFDDPAVGLQAEPFVSGIPEMIDVLVKAIPHAERGFRLLFSERPFPGYHVGLMRLRSEYGGNWYRWTATNMEGWLCPALFKYFPEPPARLYARAEPL